MTTDSSSETKTSHTTKKSLSLSSNMKKGNSEEDEGDGVKLLM